jgi:hypothetical protein
MEKSIETIWKNGFLNRNALVAPKLNNLYDQKSKHIIDKFNRMFTMNLKAIVIGSIIVLAVSFLVRIPVMGVLLFLIANAIVIINRRLRKELPEIDVNASSYEYLTAFDNWLKKQLALNTKLARIYYPLIFLSVVLGFWFSNDIRHIIASPDQMYLFYGLPIFWLLGVLIIAGILSYFGGVIYNWDVNIVYGNVFKKLDEIIADMEELRT